MIIYLCRHGHKQTESKENTEPLLTEEGHQDAEAIAQWMKKSPHGIPTTIWSSPKKRCVQTAIPTAKMLNQPITISPFLIEHNGYGPLDYNLAQIWREFNEQPIKLLLWWSGPLEGTPIREEKPFAYFRARAFLTGEIVGDEVVAVFAHDCFNSIFIWAFYDRGCLTEEDRYPQREGCINILRTGEEPIINLNPRTIT